MLPVHPAEAASLSAACRDHLRVLTSHFPPPQSFECVLFGATALARLGDRCWAALVPRAGDWLRPFAALLLAAPPPHRMEVRGRCCASQDCRSRQDAVANSRLQNVFKFARSSAQLLLHRCATALLSKWLCTGLPRQLCFGARQCSSASNLYQEVSCHFVQLPEAHRCFVQLRGIAAAALSRWLALGPGAGAEQLVPLPAPLEAAFASDITFKLAPKAQVRHLTRTSLAMPRLSPSQPGDKIPQGGCDLCWKNSAKTCASLAGTSYECAFARAVELPSRSS